MAIASLPVRPEDPWGLVDFWCVTPEMLETSLHAFGLFVSCKSPPDLQCGKEAASHLLTSGSHEINGKSNFLLQLHPKTASISPPHLLMRTELGEHVSLTVPCDKSAACLLIHLIILLMETSHKQKYRDLKIVLLFLIYLAVNSMY